MADSENTLILDTTKGNEFGQIQPDGTYYLIGLRSEAVDMTRFVSNGSPGASVTEQIIQGFSPAGELIFQWRAWDNFDIHDQAAFIDSLRLLILVVGGSHGPPVSPAHSL